MNERTSKPAVPLENEWTKFFGGQYAREHKMPFVQPVLDRLDSRGELDVIVDVGSGMYPLSYQFHGKKKTILIDIAAPNGHDEHLMYMRFDIDNLTNTTKEETRDALRKACSFLGIKQREEETEECNPEQIDLVIFSEILNYVDYQKAVRNFCKYLKPGGRVMIVNGADRGIRQLFSPKGVKKNMELMDFLWSEGLELEDMSYPWGNVGGNLDRENLMFLVFRKPEVTPGAMLETGT